MERLEYSRVNAAFLVDRNSGRAYATVLCPSVCRLLHLLRLRLNSASY